MMMFSDSCRCTLSIRRGEWGRNQSKASIKVTTFCFPFLYLVNSCCSSITASLFDLFLAGYLLRNEGYLGKGGIWAIWAGNLRCIKDTQNNAILSDHPTLAFSHRVQKSVLYICVSFCLAYRVIGGWSERIAMKHVYYQVLNSSPAQVGCMRQVLRAGALGWPSGMGCGGRWEGGSGWGTPTCKSMADSCHHMAKTTTIL